MLQLLSRRALVLTLNLSEPEELPRSRSPLKILTEEDVASMPEHGELSASNYQDAEILRECFLNPLQAREYAHEIYEQMRQKKAFSR